MCCLRLECSQAWLKGMNLSMIDISKLVTTNSVLEEYKKGDIIFLDGDTSNSKMYIILAGSVSIYKNYALPSELRIASLNAGEFFGEMSLFLRNERTATVVAAEGTTAFTIDTTSLMDFLTAQPEITLSLIQTLCKRLDSTNINASVNRIRYDQAITRLVNEKSTLVATSNSDTLTGVYNKRYFLEIATVLIGLAAREDKKSFTILFDIDYFREVNYTHGYTAGDHVLKAFAYLVNNKRGEGDIFARYGGNEFVMLLSCESADEALAFVEGILQQVSENVMEIEDTQVTITASAGISEISPGILIETAVLNADRALYQAKNNGRNNAVVYDPDIF